MSCQLSMLANIQHIKSVRKYLFPHLQEESKTEETYDGWDESDWGWKDDEEILEETTEKAVSEQLSWLQECQVSLSPAGDLMAIANSDKLVLLAQKWNSSQEDVQITYHGSFQGCIKQDEGEHINCLMCLPLASQKRSTQGGPDWTCVIVGFNSGYVRMYTESGTLLLSQIFSEEPVQRLKCQTYEPPRHSADAEKHEELSILYRKSLVTIDGFSLFQSLRACRNQVARAAASGSDWIQPPPLAYKKWGLHEQEQVVDHASGGLQTPNPFDQMMVGSMLGGYTASIRSTPPASHLYLTAGVGPCVGFFHAIEGSAQPMLSDVAHIVASKLKSALFNQISAASGWLGFGGKPTQENHKEKKKPKIEPATSLPPRFGLHDKRREGEYVVLSPDCKLAAVTDSFGRVMLVDVWRGVAVRLWKGYRDAQVGWVDVKEDTHQERESSTGNRHAMFLVIYAPRRGIIEVWTAQQGPRIAAFNVSKWCRLLCPTHGMMGLNNVTYKSVRVVLHHVYLLDPEGTIKTVDIPFHLVLSDKNSKRARDMHLLKKLKISLKENDSESDALKSEVIGTLLDIKIASIRQQGLERVLQTKYLSPAFLLSINSAVCEQLEDLVAGLPDQAQDQLDYESRALVQFCHAQEHLLNTYIALRDLNQHTDEPMEVDADSQHETLCKVLGLTSEEIQNLLSELEEYHTVSTTSPHVRFQENSELSVYEFLSCFECQMLRQDSILEVSGEATEEDTGGSTGAQTSTIRVQIHSSLHELKLNRLANFLFKTTLERGTSSDYNKLLRDSSISPENLLSLLLQMWLVEDRKYLEDLIPLHSLVKSISCLKNPADVMVEHNRVSPWWQSVRTTCCQSYHISSAVLASLVGRSVAMEMAKLAMQEALLTGSSGSDKVDLSEWESVTIDRTQWTVLIKQLEDLLAVQCLLHMKPAYDGLLNRPAWEAEPISVSVKKVMEKGRGVLPELIAKWIAGQGILPSMLCLSEVPSGGDTEKHEAEAMETDERKGSPKKYVTMLSTPNPIISQLQKVQRRLPHSLETDILMANCAWEYMVLWNKDPELMFPMEQALSFLKCIQNAILQHGVATMMWQMFVVKKLSAAALLMEKVGKAPKDRLCRKEVGLSDISLGRFMKVLVDMLEVIMQAREDGKEVPMFNVEDLWQSIQGPSSLVELALEQKATNPELVEHHYSLCVTLHAILTFSMKSAKPMSLFDTKGRNAFFKPLQSSPVIPSKVIDESLATARRQFMCRVISLAVQMSESKENTSAGSPKTPRQASSSPPPSPNSPGLTRSGGCFQRWQQLMQRISRDLYVDEDALQRHLVCELYSSSLDKMAEEVLLTVTDHEVMGSQLLLIAGQRMAQRILVNEDPESSVDTLSKCSPKLSTWLRTLDPSQLRVPVCTSEDLASLVGNVINQLPEGHAEYNLAIELVELAAQKAKS